MKEDGRLEFKLLQFQKYVFSPADLLRVVVTAMAARSRLLTCHIVLVFFLLRVVAAATGARSRPLFQISFWRVCLLWVVASAKGARSRLLFPLFMIKFSRGFVLPDTGACSRPLVLPPKLSLTMWFFYFGYLSMYQFLFNCMYLLLSPCVERQYIT